MFQFQWEELNIKVSLKPDKTFSCLNIDQRSKSPTKEAVKAVMRDQERFQTIELDQEDVQDIIEGLIQFYELFLQVWTDDSETHSYIIPSKLLSTSKEEQEDEIAWILEEFGILEEIQEKM